MINEIYTDDVTTTGSGWGYLTGVDPATVEMLALDLGDMGSGDEIQISWLFAINTAEAPTLVAETWTVTASGTDATRGFVSPPMPAAKNGQFSIEQTAGAAFDVKVRVWQVT